MTGDVKKRSVLEDFSGQSPRSRKAIAAANVVQVEEERVLESFENGYKAGWDDAHAAHTKEQATLRREIAAALQDSIFTYHEVRGEMLRGLQPLIVEIVRTLLPAMAQQSLGNHIVEQIEELGARLTDKPVEIHLSPADVPPIERIVEAESGLNPKLVKDAELEPGQAILRVGDIEKQIDVAAAVSALNSAVEAFFEQSLGDQSLAG